MHPVLFEFGLHGREFAMTSYTFFLVLAATAAIGLGCAIARRRGLDARKSTLCLLIGFATASIGARLVHWLTNPSSFSSFGAVVTLDRSNLSAFAGLVLSVPAVVIVARRLRIDAWRLADASAPALGVAVAIARVGCFLNGCCFGVPTRALWGVVVASGSDAHLAQITSGSIGVFDGPLPVHPIQLYESAAAIVGAFAAVWLLRRSHRDGIAFLSFAAWLALFRWADSRLLYVSPSFSAPHWLYPALYAIVITGATTKLLMLLRKPQTAQY